MNIFHWKYFEWEKPSTARMIFVFPSRLVCSCVQQGFKTWKKASHVCDHTWQHGYSTYTLIVIFKLQSGRRSVSRLVCQAVGRSVDLPCLSVRSILIGLSVESLMVIPSVNLTIGLPVSESLGLSFCQCRYWSLCQSVSLSVSQSVYWF
jgi:hypothetical protein